VQLSQEEDNMCLGLHLDRRLTWHKHIFAKWKQLEITLTKIYWLLGRKSKLSTSNKLLIYKTILKPIWTYRIQLSGMASAFADNTAVVTMDSDPAIASQKLQTDLLAIQNWFKKWRMKANESKTIHVTYTTLIETCPPPPPSI
jgi:hypothetical protein